MWNKYFNDIVGGSVSAKVFQSYFVWEWDIQINQIYDAL